MTRERTPTPGVTWGSEPIPVEVLDGDGDWVEIGTMPPQWAEPEPYRPNRATRRAAARAARRRTT